MGRKYGVDPTLMMAIAEFETGHGSSYSARVRNNIAGIMDGKRHRVYRSIREGIEAQAALLKAGYISKGLTTIPQIGRKYSPTGASNDPYNTNWQWPSGVQREYNRIRAASLKDTTAASAPRAGGGGGPAPTSVMMNPTISVTGVSGSPESHRAAGGRGDAPARANCFG